MSSSTPSSGSVDTTRATISCLQTFHTAQAQCCPPAVLLLAVQVRGSPAGLGGSTHPPSPIYSHAGSNSTVRVRPDLRADENKPRPVTNMLQLQPWPLILLQLRVGLVCAQPCPRPTQVGWRMWPRAQLPPSRAQKGNLHLDMSTPRP